MSHKIKILGYKEQTKVLEDCKEEFNYIKDHSKNYKYNPIAKFEILVNAGVVDLPVEAFNLFHISTILMVQAVSIETGVRANILHAYVDQLKEYKKDLKLDFEKYNDLSKHDINRVDYKKAKELVFDIKDFNGDFISYSLFNYLYDVLIDYQNRCCNISNSAIKYELLEYTLDLQIQAIYEVILSLAKIIKVYRYEK